MAEIKSIKVTGFDKAVLKGLGVGVDSHAKERSAWVILLMNAPKDALIQSPNFRGWTSEDGERPDDAQFNFHVWDGVYHVEEDARGVLASYRQMFPHLRFMLAEVEEEK